MHANDALREADRLMTICNSCRYCEGLCAVFPAMETRRAFSSGDLRYLANLCHGCGACHQDCQFAPPHEFDINIPKTMARVRVESYKSNTWPAAFAGAFDRNGLTVAIATALCVTAFILGLVGARDWSALFRPITGAGAFYSLIPHDTLALMFGSVFLYALCAMAMGVRAFWRDADRSAKITPDARAIWRAVIDAGRLRHLDGGGGGCGGEDDQPTDHRRMFHHMTFHGFMLCFAATSVATLYHYAGYEAPYAWWQPPVVLGALGGIGLTIGPVGLLWAKMRRDPMTRDDARLGMDVAFIAMIFLSGLTGMLLLIARDTALMPGLFALHLGVIFSLFAVMPYSKFVHGLYRFAALVRYAMETRAHQNGSENHG